MKGVLRNRRHGKRKRFPNAERAGVHHGEFSVRIRLRHGGLPPDTARRTLLRLVYHR